MATDDHVDHLVSQDKLGQEETRESGTPTRRATMGYQARKD